MSDQRMFEIQPNTPQWNAWLQYHRGTKEEQRMLQALAALTRKRAQWLHGLLVELLSSDIPSDDIQIQEHADLRTIVVIRGVPRHEFANRIWWVTPTPMPPERSCDRNSPKPAEPARQKLEKPSVGDVEFAALTDRLLARAERDETETKEEKKRSRLEKTQGRLHDDALAAARENRNPKVDDSDHLGTIAVDDPNEALRLVQIGAGAPMKVRVQSLPRLRVVSLRDDPVGRMAKRGQLGDTAETKSRLQAAREWQTIYERAEIGGARGIDPTRDHVDGGRYEMPDTDSSLRAQEILNRLRGELGVIGDRLATWVLGEKFPLSKVAVILGKTAAMDVKVLGHRFRECLDTIAVELGHSLDGARGPRRERDEFDRLAHTGNNPTLHRAIGLAKMPGPTQTPNDVNSGKPTLGLRSRS
jgi:hypothetical protein